MRCMQMQEQQAELEASLQQKQLEIVQAAERFQPVIANLEKVCILLLAFRADGVQSQSHACFHNRCTRPASFGQQGFHLAQHDL